MADPRFGPEVAQAAPNPAAGDAAPASGQQDGTRATSGTGDPTPPAPGKAGRLHGPGPARATARAIAGRDTLAAVFADYLSVCTRDGTVGGGHAIHLANLVLRAGWTPPGRTP